MGTIRRSVSRILKSTSVLSYCGCLRWGGTCVDLSKRSNKPPASTSTLWPLRKSMQLHLLNARGSWSRTTFSFSQFAANPTSPVLGFPINMHAGHLHPHFSGIRVCGPAVSRHFILPSKWNANEKGFLILLCRFVSWQITLSAVIANWISVLIS